MTRARLILSAIVVLGCGGDDGDGSGEPGGPIAPAEAQQLCAEFMDHASTCGWGGNVNGADWNCGDASVVWREDVFRGFAGCATELPCDGDGLSCYGIVTDAAPLAIHDEYAMTCEERSAACDLTADGDTSTLLLSCRASSLAAYAVPLVESVIACLESECAEVVPCLDDQL